MQKWLLVTCKRRQVFCGAIAFLIIGIAFGLFGIDYLDEWELAGVENQPSTMPTGKIGIAIHVTQRTLQVYSDDQLYKTYRIAVGKSETPTPIGEWNVVWKAYDWGSGFGTRWMGLNVPWGIYGIHGTNKPWSIGQFASHGCIRMRNKDVEELFEWVPINTPVRIEGRKIKVERILKMQTVGADVVLLQLKLRELGHYSNRADGIFGTVTAEAVKAYQQANGLDSNGIVDKKMVELLDI